MARFTHPGSVTYGIQILDAHETYEDFIAEHPTGDPGDAHLVGDHLYSWNSELNEWVDGGDIVGPAGIAGATGPAGSDAPTNRIYSGSYEAIIDSSGNTTFDGQLLPSVDNLYTLGTEEQRWKGIHIGPSSLYLTENEGDTVTLSTQNGILYVNGADLIRIGNMNFTNTGIESAITSQDITIGNAGDTGYLSTARGVKFPDNSVQTTAYTFLSISHLDGNQNPFSTVDLSKQILVMSDGTWLLPDGTEGQIMYFVQGNGGSAEDSYLTVVHLRYNVN